MPWQDAYSVNPWSLRKAAMPWIPGSPDQIVPRLGTLLRRIATSHSVDDRLEWPDGGGATSVRAAARAIGGSGLTLRTPARALGITDEARHWLETGGDDAYLMALFHRNVRFFGEMLAAVKAGRKTHEELRRLAASEFSLPWESLDQVRRRTNWLRGVGFLELWSNNELVLQDAGEKFLASIELATPDIINIDRSAEDISSVSFVSRSGTRIATLIDGLDQRALQDRKRAISYIPAGDPIDVVQQLVSLADTVVTRDKVEELCGEEFDISASSARMALGTLRAADLLEQVGPKSFSISPLALEWIESDDPLDLVRIFHCKFLGILECIPLMETVIGASELSRRLELEYGIARLTTSEVAIRLRIMEAAGLVQRVTQMSCRRTALGEALTNAMPLLDRISDKGTSSARGTDGGSTDVALQEAEWSKLQVLSAELVAASTDVSNTARFELAIADALEFLGFASRHLGGPGKTDVIVNCWLRPGESRTVAIDAKVASSGVKESLEFDILREHRKVHRASHSVVVAPGFDDRILGWAREHDVALITAEQLVSILRAQTAYPLTLPDLAEIFNVDGIESLTEKWVAAKRQDDILADVVQRLWQSANNTGHIQASGGALTARDLWLMMNSDESAASQNEIEEVLRFLASPLINAAANNGRDTYVSQSPPSVVAARLGAVRSAIEGRPRMDIGHHGGAPRMLSNGERAKSPRTEHRQVPDPAKVRAWARSQGVNVSHRGRLPRHLVEQYQQATRPGVPQVDQETFH